jgi:hypothetical protein
MDLLFKRWYEASSARIPFEKADDIRRGFQYKPGTFGIEIEFAINKYFGDGSLVNRELIDRTYLKGVSYPGLERAVETMVEKKSQEYVQIFSKAGIKVQYGDSKPWDGVWGVGPDAFLVEVRSPALTMEDVPELLKVIKLLENEEFHGGTSAHVHVGVPPDTDAFDLIAVTAMPDETAIKKDAGEGRKFNPFAKLSEYQHEVLFNLFPRDGEFTIEEVKNRFVKDKFVGVNINALDKHGTVEFRHLSSQILRTPEKFVKWIEYFLMLPHLAQKKKQITIQDTKGTYKTFTRVPKGVRVTTGKSDKMPAEKPEDLRTGEFFKKEQAPASIGDKIKIVPNNFGITITQLDAFMMRVEKLSMRQYASMRKQSMIKMTALPFSERTAHRLGLPKLTQKDWIDEMNLLDKEISAAYGEKLSEILPNLSGRSRNSFMIVMMANGKLDPPPWKRVY